MATGTEKKAAAVKAVITALQPVIPGIAGNPELVADVNKLIDDVVAFKNQGKGPRPPLNKYQLAFALLTAAMAISAVDEQAPGTPGA